MEVRIQNYKKVEISQDRIHNWLRPGRAVLVKGALWENYLISEHVKYHRSRLESVKLHFCLTYDHQELDLLESDEQGLSAFEIKWKEPDRWKVPRASRSAYPDAPVSLIHQDNFLEWL